MCEAAAHATPPSENPATGQRPRADNTQKMRNNLTRSLSGQSNPTPRSTRKHRRRRRRSITHKNSQGPRISWRALHHDVLRETEVAQSTEWNVTVVATTAGPPSHKPHKRITLELREKMTTLRDLKDIVEGHGARWGPLWWMSGRWVASTRSYVFQDSGEATTRRTHRHGSNYGEIEIEVDYQPPKKLQSFGKGLFLTRTPIFEFS